MLKILRSLGFGGEKNISGYSLVSSLFKTIKFSSITFPKMKKKIIAYKSAKVMKTPNNKLLKNEQYINHIDFWHSIIKIQYISNHLKPKNFKECKFGHSWINESKSPIYSTVYLYLHLWLKLNCIYFSV